MKNKLVIVESPAKAKTIGKFLGKNYVVKASVGHIRDLPKSKLGIDVDNNFEPYYITIRGKGDVIKELKKETKKADKVYLATDPDREGEAISWHLSKILKLDENDAMRIEFHEITKKAVTDAAKHPRKIDENLVDAQQARRVLDRLVGYNISPLLWRKIEKGLSAGRVQSVALKLIIDREREIRSFKPEEYWTLDLELTKNRKKLTAKYYGYLENEKIKKFKIKTEEEVNNIIASIDQKKLPVYKVEKTKKHNKPYPPFTTSSLQQEANRKLNFTAKKTMMVAQQLYEGINIKGEGSVGLVTYIRTDSFRLSDEALDAVRDYIVSAHGEKYYTSRVYTKSKKSEAPIQDAHEAIRPTSVLRSPDKIKDNLTSDQFKLYSLIWKRFVACQMSDSEFDITTIVFNSNDNIFKTSGSIMTFDGYKAVYGYSDGNEDTILPAIEETDILDIKKIEPLQHFTQPPARYTEATLIKVMEVLGIGRPSTYAPTIITISNREYVKKEKANLVPTELGFLVTEMMEKYFSTVVNEKFTADMENHLDEIATGKMEWHSVIADFYKDFKVYLDIAEKEMEKIEVKDEVSDVPCDKCGAMMVVKKGRYGKFLACPNYPECKNTRPLKEKEVVEETDIECEKCGAKMLKRKGRFGEFLACSNYPECKNTKQIANELDVVCPKCNEGKIAVKHTKKGRKFYGCTKYPDCDFVIWYEPTGEKCEKCGSPMIKKNEKTVCSNSECEDSGSKKTAVKKSKK